MLRLLEQEELQPGTVAGVSEAQDVRAQGYANAFQSTPGSCLYVSTRNGQLFTSPHAGSQIMHSAGVSNIQTGNVQAAPASAAAAVWTVWWDKHVRWYKHEKRQYLSAQAKAAQTQTGSRQQQQQQQRGAAGQLGPAVSGRQDPKPVPEAVAGVLAAQPAASEYEDSQATVKYMTLPDQSQQ